MRRVPSLVAPSSRLLTLLGGDLPGHRRETGENGWVRFVPTAGGPILNVASRIEKRFLGRTEIAVFEADVGVPMSVGLTVALSHTGGLRRSGIAGKATKGGDAAVQVARLLGSDRDLAEALLPLDFKRFEVSGDPSGSRAQVELMGASHVAMALPPIRSYVHLYPDQRDAMVRGLVRLREILASA